MSGKLAFALVVVAGAGIGAFLMFGGSDDRYMVKVELANAGGLRKGANVRVAGAPAGRVADLRLDGRDLAVAELRLDPAVAPVGAGASAVVDTDGFFGERFVQIDRGDVSRPAPSGTVIDATRASVSTRLDDVVDALDFDTQEALRAFLNEQGAAVVGRGRDLAAVLAALPPALDRTGELLDQFATDNRALGRLIESSDRVVAEVARERTDFGRLLHSFGATLEALDSRRANLGETFRRAPAALRSARATLTSLQAAAEPLIPAARGLRSTAPALTATLAELPRFTADAIPALKTITRVAPDLQQLGTRATPIVRELQPLATELSTYTQKAFGPFTALLDSSAGPDLLGTMEGWARSTQGRDASSHIFRFGATGGSDTLALLLQPPPKRRKGKPLRAPRVELPSKASNPKLPDVKVPQLPDVRLPDLPGLSEALDAALGDGKPIDTPLIDFLLGP